ncbi:hypothetical protein AJ79_05255 [Helicocarpus griseus UAMH5409]|uniref:C2H2-type domain-containing protein n=1 Tax=Helicocarpus griseus UAMH5409 TaxID=1447875 RepID=A0A2B7XQ58_9EURO|nr:hypothetical protein AJ79_05255 [Helicocarpus griseus UAMH5409]
MSQSYSLSPSHGRRMVPGTVSNPGYAPSNFDGRAAWDLQGISDGDLPRNIDVSSYNAARPGTGASYNDIDLNLNIGSPPPLSFPSSSFNGNSFQAVPPGKLNSAHQEAWNPVRVTGLVESAVPPRQSKRQRMDYSEGSTSGTYQNVSSDLCSQISSQINGQPLSDSGYGTRSPATASVISYPMNHAFHPPMLSPYGSTAMSYTQSHHQYPFGHQQQDSETMSQANEPLFTCDVDKCPWTGKCQSDKKKHMLRHQKRFVCEEAGCNRRDGFGTINDLERHQSCCHGIEPKHGSKKKFKCFATGCSRREKIWPRFDNFKQHLKRMHKDQDTDELLRLSKEWHESQLQAATNNPEHNTHPTSLPQEEVVDPNAYRPSMLSEISQLNAFQSHRGETTSMYNGASTNVSDCPSVVQSGNPQPYSVPYTYSIDSVSVAAPRDFSASLGQGFISDRNDQIDWEPIPPPDQGLGQPFEPNKAGRPSSPLVVGMRQDQPLESGLDPVKAAMDLLKALGKEIPAAQAEQPQGCNGISSSTSAVTAASSEPDVPSYIDLLRINDGSRESKTKALRDLLTASLKTLDVAETTSNAPPGEQVSHTSKGSAMPSRRVKEPIKCTHEGCSRETTRPSEMKKHMKRHDRPYGCTYPRCTKKFGSKNDWKRHENTQHFQLQCWRCPVVIRTDAVNNKDETLMEEPNHEDLPEALRLNTTGEISCASLFDRADKFSQHLQCDHGYNETEARVTVKENKIGRNGQFKFWCGFCRKLISLRKEGLDAWDERFDHIDNEHFKKKQPIADWLHPEGNRTKRSEEEEIAAQEGRQSADKTEGVGGGGANSLSSDGGEEESTATDKVPTVAPTEPVRKKAVSFEQPATSSSHGRPRRSRAPVRQVPTRTPTFAQPTKRKFTPSIASSLPGNSTVAQRPSCFNSSPLMFPPPPPQQQMASPTAATVSIGTRRGALINPNQLGQEYYNYNINNMILIDKNPPDLREQTVVTCSRRDASHAIILLVTIADTADRALI